jgi:hypothetical protein
MSIEDSIKQIVEDKVQTVTKSYFSRLTSENYSMSEKLKWTENKLTELLEKLSSRNNDFKDGEISGDKISGGKINGFSSVGIKDKASNTMLTIENDKVVVEKNFHVNGTIQVKELLYNKAKCTDLEVDNSVRINGTEVLWADRLGNAVKKSKLTELGVLKELNVADTLTIFKNKVGVNIIEPVGPFGVVKDGIEISVDVKGDTGFVGTVNSDPFAIGSGGDATLYISHDNKVGIKIKKPKADLDVAGYIRYQGQTQQYLDSAPTAGTWSQGDIVWNTQPERGSVLGWVCVKTGAPGTWRPFVSID